MHVPCMFSCLCVVGCLLVARSAVFPLAASITWKKVPAKAAITSTLIGMPLAITTWLVTAAKLNDGKLSLATTGQDYPM